MMQKIILNCLLFLTLLSCASQKKIETNVVDNSDRPSGGNFDVIESRKTFYSVSIIEIYSLVKQSDTIKVNELFCSDSIEFKQAFKDIKVPDFCKEIAVQGKTYYSVNIDSTGAFEGFKALRKVDQCFDTFDEKVELQLRNMKVLSSEFFNSELIFYHDFRLN